MTTRLQPVQSDLFGRPSAPAAPLEPWPAAVARLLRLDFSDSAGSPRPCEDCGSALQRYRLHRCDACVLNRTVQ